MSMYMIHLANDNVVLFIVTTDTLTVAYLFVELRFWLKYRKYILNRKTRTLHFV